MKQLLLAVALGLSGIALGQSNAEDVDVIQGVYGKEKKAIMADFVELQGTQSDAFWTLYDEYETKRKELGKDRVSLLDRYVSNFETMDDATTSQLIRETADLGAKTDKLVLTYYKKMEKAAGVKAAAQFYELELYFLSAIRLHIFEKIPEIKDLK